MTREEYAEFLSALASDIGADDAMLERLATLQGAFDQAIEGSEPAPEGFENWTLYREQAEQQIAELQDAIDAEKKRYIARFFSAVPEETENPAEADTDEPAGNDDQPKTYDDLLYGKSENEKE